MATRTFQVIAALAVVALVAAVSLTVVTGDDSVGKGDDSVGKRGDFLRHLHGMAHHMHGGAHGQNPMAKLIEQLELTPDQLQRFEKIHEIIGGYGHDESAMVKLHEQLVTQFDQGQLETDEIRRVVDAHVEQMRDVGYAVTDELVALVNELDGRQREILSEHLHGH